MKNNAKVSGILSIIAGSMGLLCALILIIVGIVIIVSEGNSYSDFYNWTDYAIGIFCLVCGVFYGLLGALGIAGGVFALKKRMWGLALAGSIAGILTFWLCGIPALIFTAMGKSEFGSTVTPQATAPPVEKIVG